jgi:hypothetical protein
LGVAKAGAIRANVPKNGQLSKVKTVKKQGLLQLPGRQFLQPFQTRLEVVKCSLSGNGTGHSGASAAQWKTGKKYSINEFGITGVTRDLLPEAGTFRQVPEFPISGSGNPES